jgi:hypothetical protein
MELRHFRYSIAVAEESSQGLVPGKEKALGAPSMGQGGVFKLGGASL